MLRGAAGILQRARLREKYAGDLLWKVANGLYSNFKAPTYSEYVDSLYGVSKPAPTEEETIKAAGNILAAFMPKDLHAG